MKQNIMWEAIFVKPVVNLLILIQNFMPGQDLGLAILVFTIIVRFAMWPLIKKQIHQTRLMQKVTPEVTAIRAKAKGSKDRAVLEKVNADTMAVYKKHGINPFSSIGTLLVQLPLFIAIYSAVRTAFTGTQNLSRLLYGPIENLPYVKEALAEGGRQVTTFADWADLARRPFSNNEVYIPVLIIALASIAIQYFQVKQTMPPKQPKSDDPSQKLTNSTPYIMVILFGWISLSVEGAISFYLASGSLVAIFQQAYLMNKEKVEGSLEEAKKPTVKVLTSKEDKESKSTPSKGTSGSTKSKAQNKNKPSTKNTTSKKKPTNKSSSKKSGSNKNKNKKK